MSEGMKVSDLRNYAAVTLGHLALRLATPSLRDTVHEVIRRGMGDMDRHLARQATTVQTDTEESR